LALWRLVVISYLAVYTVEHSHKLFQNNSNILKIYLGYADEYDIVYVNQQTNN